MIKRSFILAATLAAFLAQAMSVSARASFLQVDPIGYADQMNLYAYVYNDPINNTDSTGQCGPCVAGIPLLVRGAIAATAVITTYVAGRNAVDATADALVSESNSAGRGGDGRQLSPQDNGPPSNQPGPSAPPPFIPDFTGHGAERSEERGLPGMVAGDTILSQDSVSTPGDNDTTVFFNQGNNVTVIISNETGAVVTIREGAPNGPEGQRIQEQLQEQENPE